MSAIPSSLRAVAEVYVVFAGLLIVEGRLAAQDASTPRSLPVDYATPAKQLRSAGKYVFGCGVVDPVGGRTIVIDRDSSVAIEIASNGAVLKRTNLLGQGNGEIESCMFAGWLGDKLWISDLRLGRINLFDIHDWQGTSRLVDVGGVSEGERFVRAVVTGSVVLLEPSEISDLLPEGTVRLALVILSIGTQQVGIDTLMVLETRHRSLVSVQGDSRAYIGFQPWNDDPLVGISPRADLMARVDRRVATSGARAAVQVRVSDMHGTAIASWAYYYVPLALSDSSVRHDVGREAKLMDRIPQFRDSSFTYQWLAQRVFRPTFWPGVSEIMISRDSSIWLKHSDRHQAKPEQALWTRHDLYGKTTGTFTLPVFFVPLDSDEKSVTGVDLEPTTRVLRAVVRFRFSTGQ